MDIGVKNGYPACELSNLFAHPFIFEGLECNSMESFLQSLKFANFLVQVETCKLPGLQAKYRGRCKKWWKYQVLFWRGVKYDRHSTAYQQLLNRAYLALYTQNEEFRKALKSVPNGTIFEHSIGKENMRETVLTRNEFCSRLMWLRGMEG